jgi:hypothetical protein
MRKLIECGVFQALRLARPWHRLTRRSLLKARKAFLVGCLVVWVVSGVTWADDSPAELRRQVEELETRLKLAEQSIELLEKEADALRAENAKLKKEDVSSGPKNEADPFRVGVVWVGEAKTNGKVGKWAISISERDGTKLSGVAAVIRPDGQKIEIEVSGRAPREGNGLVVLESAVVGRAKMFLRGRLVNGEIALAFSGTNRLGEKTFGSATLRPKN